MSTTSPSEGPVAIVTGATSGIGAATAEALAVDGYRVTGWDVVVPPMGAPGVAAWSKVDVSDECSVEAAVGDVVSDLGRIDLIVNNAGVLGGASGRLCHETDLATWEHVFGVNVRGPFLVAKHTIPVLLRAGTGHIVNVASAAGLVAFPARCAYTSSKGAVVQLTRSLAVDYGRQGVRANAVCPGFVRTPMTRRHFDEHRVREETQERIPTGRIAQPEDVASVITALASDRMNYLNGAVIPVDGGFTAM